MKHKALDCVQFALPGQTCNNAVLDKTLFLDLSRQTLTPGILMEYDITAAFDRVLAGLSTVTWQRVGLPRVAGNFMVNLLNSMSFHLITGFGQSEESFSNNQEGIIGQGVLQGSSSAGSLFLLNSDISLSTYRQHGTGAAFIHPIDKTIFLDKMVQNIDDTSQFLNPLGADLVPSEGANISNLLLPVALQIPNFGQTYYGYRVAICNKKCYYYAFSPTIN
jgi:hypothetical protein